MQRVPLQDGGDEVVDAEEEEELEGGNGGDEGDMEGDEVGEGDHDDEDGEEDEEVCAAPLCWPPLAAPAGSLLVATPLWSAGTPGVEHRLACDDPQQHQAGRRTCSQRVARPYSIGRPTILAASRCTLHTQATSGWGLQPCPPWSPSYLGEHAVAHVFMRRFANCNESL